MLLGFGWCHLRSSYEALRHATLEEVDAIDAEIDKADEQLWSEFRKRMEANQDPWLQWQLHEQLNNHRGLLTYCVSRNHRTSEVWPMLEWIARNGPGSYGLFYCHDDEDAMVDKPQRRMPPMDFDNVFRVHRIMNGQLMELDDPFFGLVEGNIDPVHPFHRATDPRDWGRDDTGR